MKQYDRIRKSLTGYLRQRFSARGLPETIDVHGEMIAGPFCLHCGNPFSMHGPDLQCPDHRLHPLFPMPRPSVKSWPMRT